VLQGKAIQSADSELTRTTADLDLARPIISLTVGYVESHGYYELGGDGDG
jgi:hypothetical protein